MKTDSAHFLGRRKFLLSCALGLVSLSSTPLLFGWWQESRAKVQDCSRLEGHQGVQSLGKKYLQSNPQEANSQVLRSFIPPTNSAIRAKIIHDFDRGDLVSFDGWLLSRTECRVCALSALTVKVLG